ncbi:SGNH/GDSL hydrolase family protein [Aestuariibacter halophilus]|uniref:SGNH/GDSL hydrolase family protein n=1 Tax=Fluctibacter halophilus TaxID=226011 RepID=A0ABS8G5I8_9ALTE|nr:SGNH/GDSL hydrolase family protein [Aestuariibacter halophilus]MCC2615135.1 SGNH/GDSL hydrolase family protein [Aestuariibacter halophilus]
MSANQRKLFAWGINSQLLKHQYLLSTWQFDGIIDREGDFAGSTIQDIPVCAAETVDVSASDTLLIVFDQSPESIQQLDSKGLEEGIDYVPLSKGLTYLANINITNLEHYHDKQLIIWGQNWITKLYQPRFEQLTTAFQVVNERSSENTLTAQINREQLLDIDPNKYLIVVCDESLETVEWLENKGFMFEKHYIFIGHPVEYSGQYALDPHLGHAYTNEAVSVQPPYDYIPGFLTLSNSIEPTHRIVVLGGSTTEGGVKTTSHRRWTNWAYFLHLELCQKDIPHIIYNGAVSGYQSTQDLLKVIREVIYLNPDNIIYLSGANDISEQQGLRDYPAIHRYQHDVFSKLQKNSPERGLNYGRKHNTSAAQRWYNNVSMMAAIAASQGIQFQCFLQPFLNPAVQLSDEEKQALANYDLRYAYRFTNTFNERLDAFYSEAKKLAVASPYITDISDAFDDQEACFRDMVHLNSKGNGILAKIILNKIGPLSG